MKAKIALGRPFSLLNDQPVLPGFYVMPGHHEAALDRE
jgi:hypothetical protein